ncbi:lymphocyte antigen 86 [Anolis sagrei]|uniref:lymphocyte antigen 86 n=1 Tax=Anolis sagrei TaxID=38937 RepID=UPI00351F8642
MKVFQVSPLLFLLIYTTSSTSKWPTHTVCKNDNLEVKYKSCDPRQDIAFSFESCTSTAPQKTNIRIGTVLRYPIRELSAVVSLDINGKQVPVYSTTICERDRPRFSFCGKNKGEFIYYEGPASIGFDEIPQGDFNAKVELFNEDHHIIICADFTVKSHNQELLS